MVDPSPHAFFLVGPTASGKSAVAHYIAEREGQRIVSADSMNVYQGMDIGTAKPAILDREKVEYAGIDLAEPNEKFSVAHYLDAVRPAFDSSRVLIVSGGTGLYIKCLTEGFDEVPSENKVLRSELEKLTFQGLEQRAREEASELYAQLTADDRQNPRRLIRILERKIPSMRCWNTAPKPTIVGLHVERSELHRRIAQRVEIMYNEGLLEEAAALMKNDLSSTALQAIGYAEAFAVLKHETTIPAAKERTIIRTRQLAKRQLTWFRNQLQVEWVDTARFQTIDSLAGAVSHAWKTHGATPVHI